MFSLAYIQRINAEANGGGVCKSCDYLVDIFAETFCDEETGETRGLCRECVDAENYASRRETLQKQGWL